MTITADNTAPLVVVVGSTGKQGSSVVDNLQQSDLPYRIRGLTRDPNKQSALDLIEKGVQVVACDIRVGNEIQVEEAFKGAAYVFVVTNFWEHMNKAREVAEGKLMVDAAKKVGIKLLLLSSEPSVTKVSNGRLDKVEHFDSKAEVSEYARSTGIPFVEIHVGGYMDNFMTFEKPTLSADGSYTIAGIVSPDSRLPLIDTVRDVGLFVRLGIESEEFNTGDGKIIAAYAEWVSIGDQVRMLAKCSGKKVRYMQVSIEEFSNGMKQSGLPDHAVQDMIQMFHFHEELWESTYVESNRNALARKPRSFEEWCEATDLGILFG